MGSGSSNSKIAHKNQQSTPPMLGKSQEQPFSPWGDRWEALGHMAACPSWNPAGPRLAGPSVSDTGFLGSRVS